MDTIIHGVSVATDGYRRPADAVAADLLAVTDDAYEAGALHRVIADVLAAYAEVPDPAGRAALAREEG